MTSLSVQQAGTLSVKPAQNNWMIQDLWSDQAVGILGGEPKCCKSFLALDLAVSVASGEPCLRSFPVARTGPVLLFPAEDPLCVVRQRLEGVCSAAGVSLEQMPIHVITEPVLRLDSPADQQRLAQTVERIKPVLLILDPLIRLHQVDENDSSKIAPILGYLRQLQRRFQTAVLLVHHARKDANNQRPGQALRGSSDLHGWGDSNLYMRRRGEQLTLTTEHRAAAAKEPFPVELAQEQSALALRVSAQPQQPHPLPSLSADQRILQALAQQNQALCVQRIRQLCGMRTATVCSVLKELVQQGAVTHDPEGYRIKEMDVSFPTDPIDQDGNGNGKQLRLDNWENQPQAVTSPA